MPEHVGLTVLADEFANRHGITPAGTKEQRWSMLYKFCGAAFVDAAELGKWRWRRGTRQSGQAAVVTSDAFLQSYEWRKLRMVVLKKRGARCECCGATPQDGIRINVDHVKPRKKFPELALTESNLQVLCHDCNHGKGNWDETDWRADAPATTLNH